MHDAHMLLRAGLHQMQIVAKDRTGQVGHACVLWWDVNCREGWKGGVYQGLFLLQPKKPNQSGKAGTF